MNTQKPEKPNHLSGYSLECHSLFTTIQGEGPFAGRVAIFIRLAGCNLQCPLCDTEYTKGRRNLTIDSILTEINNRRGKSMPLIVITGGEPFRQNISPLCKLLLRNGFEVQVETNGTLCSKELPDHENFHLVCSPKSPKLHPTIVEKCKDWKYVVKYNEVDTDGLSISSLENNFRPARPWELTDERSKDDFGTVWVQPADQKNSGLNKLNEEAALTSCFKFNYRLSYQIHKSLKLP